MAGIYTKHHGDGSMGLVGQQVGGSTQSGAAGEFILVRIPYTASSVTQTVFTATRRYIVKSAGGRVDVAGTNGSAVTATIGVADDGEALTSGTPIHTGTYNLKGTVDTNQSLTLATGDDLVISAGQSLGVVFQGTLTAATGALTVALCPA